MDVLTDKQIKTFDYTSRYASVPFYYHSVDGKWIYGIGQNVNKEVTWVAHEVQQYDTLDSLALEYYGNPTLYWAIAYFNDIQDCFINLFDKYKMIKIPNITSVTFDGDR